MIESDVHWDDDNEVGYGDSLLPETLFSPKLNYFWIVPYKDLTMHFE